MRNAQKYHLLVNTNDNESTYEDIELNSLPAYETTNSNYSEDSQDVFVETAASQGIYSKCSRLKGYIYASISCLFFATGSVFVKALNGQLNAMEVVMFRSTIQLVICIMVIWCKKISVWKELSKPSRVFILIRGICGGGTLVFYFYAFQNMPIGDASSIIFSSPVYISILAWLCLGEQFGYVEIITLLLSLSGVILVSRPTFLFGNGKDTLQSFENVTTLILSLDEQSNGTTLGEFSGQSSTEIPAATDSPRENTQLGALFAFLGSLFVSVSFLCLRKIPQVHYVLPVFYSSVSGIVLPFMVILISQSFSFPTEKKAWLFAVVVGICGLFGQLFLTKAFQAENAGPVSIVRQLDIVLAFLYQVLIFHESPYYLSIIGAMLIMSGTLVLALKKYMERVSSST